MSTGSIGTPGAITPAGTASQPEVAAAAETAGAPPAKTAGGPSRWAGIGAHAWVGIRYGVGAAAGMWVGDVLVLLFTRGSATWAQWLTGIGAALFVVTTIHGLSAGTDRHAIAFEVAFYGASAVVALLLAWRIATLGHRDGVVAPPLGRSADDTAGPARHVARPAA